MIKYQLACASAHEFEAWFASGTAYDALREAKRVTCPDCGCHTIEKRPMAPAIVTRRGKAGTKTAVSDAASAQTPPVADAAAPGVKAALDALRQMKSEVMANTENVGERFAEEARRIHFGESPERPIRGAATLDDARALHEDGISFGILPQLPEEQN